MVGGDLPSRLSVDSEALIRAGKELANEGKLVAIAKNRWVGPEAVSALEERALRLVGEHHKAAPLDPGLKLQTLREQLSEAAGPEVTEYVVQRMTKGKKPTLILDGEAVRLPSFEGAAQDAAAAKALAAVQASLAEAKLGGLSLNAVTAILEQQQLGDGRVARAVLAKMVRDDQAIKTGDLWFDYGAVKSLQQQVQAHLDAHDKLTIAEFKDMTGLGRKQSIPLLEHFDRNKVTKRVGSDRVRGS